MEWKKIAILSVFWLLLLVNLAASQNCTWCILAVGTVGMFQNAWLAAVEESVSFDRSGGYLDLFLLRITAAQYKTLGVPPIAATTLVAATPSSAATPAPVQQGCQ